MTDQAAKIATIHSIENLQLSKHLISALDDVVAAEQVLQAIETLIAFNQQWY